MVLDPNDVVPFLDWLPSALMNWLLVVVCVGAAVAAFGWLIGAMRHGPVAATRNALAMLRDTVVDLARLSPRRTWALARLAMKESIRRRIVVVFGIFIVLLLFAGWFLDRTNEDPARLYLNFVLTATTYLVLLLMLLLSSLSFPADIKSRTLHTIVTKPVRASETVLGRILGFVCVGTLLLAVMGSISYVFVVRGLNHTHELTADDLRPVEGSAPGEPAAMTGRTSRVHEHRHKIYIEPDGRAQVEMEKRHRHPIEVVKNGDKTTYRLGRPEGMLAARVPVYGKLEFLDRSGKPAKAGINVGDEWTYRSYIEGGTLATFIWSFSGITEKAFPNGLPVELTLGVFRTHKGEIEKGVPGSIAVMKPGTNIVSEPHIFESKEFVTDVQFIPRELTMPDGAKADLFKDFVTDGKVDIRVQCVAPGQYFGAAQADMYLRAADASFVLNFAKGYLGIWLQMAMIIVMGVTFSTFLSGPVAMLATLGALVGGFFNDFMFRLATGQTYGGGPFESFVRLLTQQNVTSQMDPGLRTTVVQTLDRPAELALRVISMILPDFGKYSFSEYVASGFNVSSDTILIYTCRMLAFALPVFIAGYLCLKNREIGK